MRRICHTCKESPAHESGPCRCRSTRPPERCEAEARRGTGTGPCDRPLDAHGYCDNPRDHLTD